MTTSTVVGSVAGIWRFPVKSMKGERIAQGEFTEKGLVGDRAYALIDVDTGKVASAKSVRLFPDLFDCSASFVEPPQPGREVPPVQITLADGSTVRSDADDADQLLSAFFGREVTLASAAPDDFTIDQYHPDIQDADPGGNRDATVEQKLGSAFFAEAGMPALRQKSLKLTGYLEFVLREIFAADSDTGDSAMKLLIISPGDIESRGCQLSLKLVGADRRLFEQMMEQGIVADFREPDVIRMAPVPLYNSFEDIYQMGLILKSLLGSGAALKDTG